MTKVIPMGFASTQNTGLVQRTLVTSAAPIIVDVSNIRFLSMIGDTIISGTKTWQIINPYLGTDLKILFTINGSFAQSFPSNFKMMKFLGDWNTSSHIWTPDEGGTYKLEADFDGTNWFGEINGAF